MAFTSYLNKNYSLGASTIISNIHYYAYQPYRIISRESSESADTCIIN